MSIVGTPAATTVGNLLTPIQVVTNDNIATIIANAANFEVVRNYYYLNSPQILNVCDLSVDNIEGGIVPICRACVPSADPADTSFVDHYSLAENYSLVCITTGSVLETMVDVGKKMGIDLFGGISSISGSFSENFGFVGFFLVAVIVIIVGISVFLKFKGKK